MVSEDWSIDITRAIAKHFSDNRNELYMHVPGLVDKRSEHQEWFELSFIGPTTTKVSSGVYRVEVVVNLLVQACVEKKNSRNPFRAAEIESWLTPLFTCLTVGEIELEPGSVQVGPTLTLTGQPHQRLSISCKYTAQIIQ